MDFLKTDIKKLYFKYLIPSILSATVTSIYFIVDAIAVGQYEGAVGSAALAVTSPTYGVMAFLSILCGIGGSVMMSTAKGEGEEEKANSCFTAACILMAVLTVIIWGVFNGFREQIFTLFGANAEVMPKTIEYGKWIIWFAPVFIFSTFMGAFIRNDGAPNLAMMAVLVGGGLNILGDWLLVFPLNMGMTGAAIASVAGTSVQAAIMASHFMRKSCGLQFVMPRDCLRNIIKILEVGLGASAVDLSSVTIGMMMNNQILRYGTTTELAIFGVMATLMALFQALFSGVGQAIQPIVSTNFGAGENIRIKKIWKYSITTVLIMGFVFTIIGELAPTAVTKFFMDATPEVLAASPGIFRLFFPMFLFLGITILTDYYLQSVMQVRASMCVGLGHSVVVSGLAVFILPAMVGSAGIWLALPLSELVVGTLGLAFVFLSMRKA